MSTISNYDLAVSLYTLVKDDIVYDLPCWDGPLYTIKVHKGHCGMKSELLVYLLRLVGIKCRLVEGRYNGMPDTLIAGILNRLGITLFDVHFWVEADLGSELLTLDPSPDPGIAHFSGDTVVGMHLGTATYITRWDEIPHWYKDAYNSRYIAFLIVLSRIELRIRRFLHEHK